MFTPKNLVRTSTLGGTPISCASLEAGNGTPSTPVALTSLDDHGRHHSQGWKVKTPDFLAEMVGKCVWKLHVHVS